MEKKKKMIKDKICYPKMIELERRKGDTKQLVYVNKYYCTDICVREYPWLWNQCHRKLGKFEKRWKEL